QRDRANGEAMSSAQPRCHAVAQAFVQNILEDTGERRDGNHREPIVLGRNGIVEHAVSYSTAKQYSTTAFHSTVWSDCRRCPVARLSGSSQLGVGVTLPRYDLAKSRNMVNAFLKVDLCLPKIRSAQGSKLFFQTNRKGRWACGPCLNLVNQIRCDGHVREHSSD